MLLLIILGRSIFFCVAIGFVVCFPPLCGFPSLLGGPSLYLLAYVSLHRILPSCCLACPLVTLLCFNCFGSVRALALFGTAFLCRRMTKRQEELSAAPPSSVSVPSSSSGSGSSNGSSGSIDSGEAPISFNFSLDEEWIVYLLDSFPSLVFCSAVSLVVLFWARIYYAANLVAYPLFSCVLLCIQQK